MVVNIGKQKTYKCASSILLEMKINLVLCILVLIILVSACTAQAPKVSKPVNKTVNQTNETTSCEKQGTCGQPTPQPPETGFCGWATGAPCLHDSDCKAGGCSGQVCGARDQGMMTTCEYSECYDAEKYHASCLCVNGICGWVINA